MRFTLKEQKKLRWNDIAEYDPSWGERNSILLEMWDDIHLADPKYTTSVAEFGCGPNAPIWNAMKSRPGISAYKFDMHAWDEKTIRCDLDRVGDISPDINVIFLSGVLEYVANVRYTFETLSRHCRYIICSYSPLTTNGSLDLQKYSDELKNRSKAQGWRNHLDLARFNEVVFDQAELIDANHWRGQILYSLQIKLRA